MAAAAFLALLPMTASAQTEQTEQEERIAAADSVAMLDKKVTTLEKIVSKLPSVSGFLQVLYNWENSDPVTSQFRIRRARITLAGRIYRELADYNMMVDFAGSPKLIDAYVRLTPWRQFNVQIGSFRPAFTLENAFYGATTMELIDYPQIVSKMTTVGEITGTGAGSAGRDLGIQAYGGFFNKKGFSMLQYYVGIFNGNGVEYTNINSHKDLAAMLRINPVKDLAFIGSLYWGKWAYGGAGTYADRRRWSAGFMFDNSKWFMRGEYIGGATGGAEHLKSLIVAPDGNTLRTDGAYLIAGVWFCNRKVAPVVRAEYYTQNTEARDKTTDIFYTAGVDYRPWRYMRVQLNYTAKTYTHSDRVGNQIMVMLTGLF